MLPPPQLRVGLVTTSSRSLLRPSSCLPPPAAILASTQARSFWGWRRGCDWSSQLDPSYQRSHHVRSLKTRAKLRAILRRRGKFEWDVLQKPFFTPKHIRWASHWNGPSGKSQWPHGVYDETDQTKRDEVVKSPEEQSYELSQKEKKWKDLMENMRKRISQDPYEAVFGTRFEPFWTPLVPRWMKDDMLDQSSKKASQPRPATTPDTAAQSTRSEANAWQQVEPKSSKAQSAQSVQSKQQNKDGSYAYSSSTTWDSWTNRTRQAEWDSVSNKTQRYEYDPITNRMVPVIDAAQVDSIPISELSSKPSPIPVKKSSPLPLNSFNESKSAAAASLGPARPAALAHLPKNDFDLLTADNVRASMGKVKDYTSAIQRSTPQKKAALEADFDVKTRAIDRDVDEILASRGSLQLGSASMSRQDPAAITRSESKTSSAELRPISQLISEQSQQADPQTTTDVWDRAEIALTPGQYAVKPNSESVLAAEEASLRHDLKSLTDHKARLLSQRQAMEVSSSVPHLEMIQLQDELVKIKDEIDQKRMDWENFGLGSSETQTRPGPLQTTLERSKSSPTPAPLQSAVERLASKKRLGNTDNSAACESTDFGLSSSSGSVPKQWSQQADLLQSDRVKRTTGNRKFPILPRWIDDMNARKAAYEADRVLAVEEQAEPSTREKMNAMLEGEIDQQKLRFRMHEARHAHKLGSRKLEEELEDFHNPRLSDHSDPQTLHSQRSSTPTSSEMDKALDRFESGSEGSRSVDRFEAELVAQKAEAKDGEERYKKKVRTLQAELETAYKQSSQHSEMHLDRIRKLEKELKRFDGSADGKRAEGRLTMEVSDQKSELEQRYRHKFRALQTELETAYKQSSKHSEMHMDQIRKLEQELAKVNKATRSKTDHIDDHPLKAMQGEGDFCTNVTKFANSTKWYKRPALSVQQMVQSTDKLGQKARDQRLVAEVRNIYEQAYGTIDAQHRQEVLMKSLASEVPTKHDVEDGDVARALSPYEKKISYGFADDGLADELKQQAPPVETDKTQQYDFNADGLADKIAQQEKEAYTAIAAKERAAIARKTKAVSQRNLTPEFKAQTSPASSSTVEPALEWKYPPVYKVLAYDSGNDKFSTATTTSNFTASEQPISIPQALSQLYHPARFVPYFADLQRDGYQVIYGTRDLLVFKLVNSTHTPVHAPQRTEHLNIHDYGLLRPYENILAQEAAMFHDSFKPSLPTSNDPSSVEYGQTFGLTPPENAMAQEAANAYDLSRANAVNPIDGTMTLQGVKPVTGNFASPTGFVNHDPVVPPAEAAAERISSEEEVVQYPKVRRQEPVFSATLPPPAVPTFGRALSAKPIHSKISKSERRRQHREEMIQWRRERQQKRRSGAGAIKWALSVGVLAAGTAYVIGSVAENARGGAARAVASGQGKERWQEILEGKRGRWE